MKLSQSPIYSLLLFDEMFTRLSIIFFFNRGRLMKVGEIYGWMRAECEKCEMRDQFRESDRGDDLVQEIERLTSMYA